MKKRVLSLLLVLCAMLTILTACKEKEEKAEPISASEAVQIVLDELDMEIEEAKPHAHTGVYDGTQCHVIYVTVNGSNLAYYVHSITGEILSVEESAHSH